MKVWVQALVTHLGHLLHITTADMVEKLFVTGPVVHVLELLLVNLKHFVYSSFVLELQG